MAAVSALSLSGRRSVTTATASDTDTSMWPDSAPQVAMATLLSIRPACSPRRKESANST